MFYKGQKRRWEWEGCGPVARGDQCASFNSLVVITNLLFGIKFGLSDVGVYVFSPSPLQ